MPESANKNMSRELTAREQQVVELVCDGCTNQYVADTLHISIETVKRHLSNIFDKLGCGNRIELSIMASGRLVAGRVFWRAYKCDLCNKEKIIHDVSEEPARFQTNIGGRDVNGLSCAKCAARLNAIIGKAA